MSGGILDHLLGILNRKDFSPQPLPVGN